MYRPRLKSNTGCIKCRTRRKKCDEKRPKCTACVKWNFTCLWPSTSRQSENADGREHDELSRIVTTVSDTKSTSEEGQGYKDIYVEPDALEPLVFRYGPSWTHKERQAFNFFQSQTSNGMSGVFRTNREMEIWSFMLLQGAHHNAGIKHAICALGALHQYLWSESNDPQGQVYLLATEQYNKAVQCTIHSTRHKHTSVDTILTMCVLFTLLERLLGDIKTAMSHLQAGIKLLGDTTTTRMVVTRQETQIVDEATSIPRDTIIALLRRLERQIFELGQTHLELGSAKAALFKTDMPAVFLSLEDASASFEAYFNDACHLMHTCEWRQNEQRQAQKPVEPGLVFLLRRILTKWTRAFMAFLQSARLERAPLSEPEQLIVHTLHLWRVVLSISLIHYQTGDEMVCDSLTPDFAEAVAHCAAVIHAQQRISEPAKSQDRSESSAPSAQEESNASTRTELQPPVSVQHAPPGTSQQVDFSRPSKSVLTFSPFSPLPALFTIAFRCRDPTVRRDAVRLLRDIDWYDAFWDSKLAFKAAERLVQIEENGYLAGETYTGHSRLVESAEQVLPAARCRQIRAQFEKPNTFVFDFIAINANDWVPGPEHWSGPSPESFCEAGLIRETWTAIR